MTLTSEQTRLLDQPIKGTTALTGPAGTGKTTAGTLWLNKLLKAGIPAQQILLFVPQRTLAKPYEESLWDDLTVTQSLLSTMTLGGLARRMLDLFWPAISSQTGVANPEQPPQFLTLETAQYYMAHVVRPLIEDHNFFDSLTINRNRIFSQILDNLNKAAFVGFPIEEIAPRLKAAWVGDVEQIHIYDNVQSSALAFRAFCLEHNLLDFSLQVEIFIKYLWPHAPCRDYLTRNYRHLIVDNIEEDTPVAHDVLREWLPDFDSALVISDTEAGYRFFLGADPESAQTVVNACEEIIPFAKNLLGSKDIQNLQYGIRQAVASLTGAAPQQQAHPSANATQALVTPTENPRYFPAMVNWTAGEVRRLIDQGTPPGEIVILAPFMSDVLRYSLSNKLDELGVPHHSHRPSRALRDEPAAQTLLTLATVAFPYWDMKPKRINFAFALMQALDSFDLVRAQLLSRYIYDERAEGFPLLPFEEVPAEVRDRITYRAGERYDQLRSWLAATLPDDDQTLDFFLNRLFGEVLSQPGFGFHDDLENANTVATLIESIQKFRWVIGEQLGQTDFSTGKEYVQMVADGVIAAQYIRPWQEAPEDSVFLAPAYTFLMRNQPVDYQFWLDIGSPSWYQRLDQPLTQPYVLSRNWNPKEGWTTEDELRAANETLQRLSLGLLNRCRQKVYLGMSEMDISGYENRGLMLRIFQEVLLNSKRGLQ
jgi:hypothetical protein